MDTSIALYTNKKVQADTQCLKSHSGVNEYEAKLS